MSFLNPFFLLGLAALAAPVLVHLVRRTRARRVEFPALWFVRRVPQRTIRRRTLHNLLLLVLRCLAVLLIVFAFTRPFFKGSEGEAASGGARHTVILLDASLSMRHADNFAEAVRRAGALVAEAREGERFALMTFDEGYEVVSGFNADPSALRAALDGLAAGYGATDYEQALRGAESLFREAKDAAAKRVVLVSDFQANGRTNARATFKLPSDVRLALVEVGDGAAANAGLTNVEARGAVFGQKYADRLAVHVGNFAEEARGPFTLDFQINDQTIEKREVTLQPREQKVVEFTDFNLAEGVNRCVVRLRADDFAPDNEFYFTLRRAAPSKALIIEGGGRGDSFYLQNALAAGGDLPYTFDVRGAGAVDPASLAAHSLVILNDAGVAPGPLTEAVGSFVEAGGRLVVAAGPNTRAEGFNRAFGRVAPAALGEAAQFRQAEGVAMTEVTASHPIFEVFRDGARPPAARVYGYRRAEPREGADVLARFEDGSPAFVEWTAGRGRVLLYTSTLGMAWSDLPLTPAYLPLVQQMVRYLGEREASAWHRLGQAFAVAKGADGSPPAIDTPSGARLKAGDPTPEGEMLLAGREPGFYRLRYAAGHEFAAVNVDGREGDFTRLNADEFLAAFTGGDPVAPAAAGERASAEEREARQRVWWPLLLAAILFLAAESLLSRRKQLAKQIG
ncbi:MAG TPA: BatA domain-containing protein [Pyrinomonadaceae bacterium]|nr:BatA domain-containing protein [Pyrinomonadaceae bacterium]